MAQNKKITCFVRETFSFLTRVAGKGGVSQVRYCYINLYEYSICAFHLLKCVAPTQHFTTIVSSTASGKAVYLLRR